MIFVIVALYLLAMPMAWTLCLEYARGSSTRAFLLASVTFVVGWPVFMIFAIIDVIIYNTEVLIRLLRRRKE